MRKSDLDFILDVEKEFPEFYVVRSPHDRKWAYTLREGRHPWTGGFTAQELRRELVRAKTRLQWYKHLALPGMV